MGHKQLRLSSVKINVSHTSKLSGESAFRLITFLCYPSPRASRDLGWRGMCPSCHPGDPLLVAGECPACQYPDCFRSLEQVSGFLLVMWSWPHRRSRLRSAEPIWTPATVSQHLIPPLADHNHVELVITFLFQLQMKQECAYTTVKKQHLCCSGSVWMCKFCSLKTKSNNWNLNLSQWGDICVLILEFLLTLQTFQRCIAWNHKHMGPRQGDVLGTTSGTL